MNFSMYRPDNALRRARDFELAGSSQQALDHLTEVIMARKMGKMWQPAHEQMMLKFVELCVEHREARRCKEGLHCYRYLQAAAGQEPPMGKVIVELISMSMKKAAEARARIESSSAALEKLDAMEDLDEEQFPESLLMGGVTSEGSRDRAERETLVPWLRHMLDTYKYVLDALRHMPQLEGLYHKVAIRAMMFCRTYNRAMEFKKVMNEMRKHLRSFLEMYRLQQEGLRDEKQRVISPEAVEQQLCTRFYALETSADMNLWSEGFRIIEDIHYVMDRTFLLPKNHLLATYFEKLARIFWVSENYLFHAYAWWRFYALSVQHNSKLTDEDKRTLASAVVLAALAIPIHAGAPSPAGAGASAHDAMLEGAFAAPDEKNRKEYLSRLLRGNSAAAPSREALLAELAAKGVLKNVRPEVAALVRLLEEEFHPLALTARARPLLEAVAAQTAPTLPAHIQGIGGASAKAHNMAQYAPNLERLLVFRLLEQLTAVYSTVRLDGFRELIGGLRTLSFHDVEKLLVRAVRQRQLALRIDHRGGVMHLGNDVMEAATMRRQLAELSARLQLLVEAVSPGEDTGVAPSRKTAVFNEAARRAESTQKVFEQRREKIKQRKEAIQRAANQRKTDVSAPPLPPRLATP
jgi:translation initiation factor 3 subunit A